MLGRGSGKKANYVIQPKKHVVDGLPILGFENEEELNLYSVWHEALVDKRREANAKTERERQIIKNEIQRKLRHLIGSTASSKGGRSSELDGGDNQPIAADATSAFHSNGTHRPSKSSKSKSPSKHSPTKRPNPSLATTDSPTTSGNRAQAPLEPSSTPLTALTANNRRSNVSHAASHIRQGSASLPNGLTILNSAHYNTLPNSKTLIKYKLTKLYNKYRGRQERRNFVIEKQRNAKIEAEISKSYLNSWLAYTALQALRLPETSVNSLSATTINNGKILTPMATPRPNTPMASPEKKLKTSSPKKQQQLQQQQQQQQQQVIFSPSSNQTSPMQASKQPMHLVYIDPGNIITYSNKINPQQVAEYRQKSHLLPSSATSKKSSAASYDVYEIMEVLANTTKTNVTITRNANRPSQTGSSASIYSHSVNANTPGIVSTQLHLQARTYLDSMSKFYTEEFERLEKEREAMKNEPSDEEVISRYINLDYKV